MSLRSLSNLETFHPGTGPSFEASLLHVKQPRLVERAETAQNFTIWDVGLGAAANAITAIEALKHLITPIEIHSFDKTVSPLEFATLHAESLGYLQDHQALVSELLKNHLVHVTPSLTWHLHLGDFSYVISTKSLPSPDAIFFDPYSPKSNLEMWQLDLFKMLYSKLDPKKPCLLTNYTRSTAVRVTLLLAGFYVGAGCDVGEKAETTVASNDASLISKPLPREWLDRVKVSRNAAPFRKNIYEDTKISDEDFADLLNCYQFRLQYRA